MSPHHRLLLVEQLDAVGASPADLRPRAQLLRKCGFDVRMVAIARDGDEDLQYGATERPQAGIERFPPEEAAHRLRRAAEEFRAELVLWASASPADTGPLRTAVASLPAWWWPSGWSAAGGATVLSELAPGTDPGDLVMPERERPRAGRLSLWDGPYALVACPLRAADAEHLFDGFARAADRRDEVDLVVLDHPDAELEEIAREAGLDQRVHFVGRAPREAESAWLQHARVAFVTLKRAVSAGLVQRALGAGCPLIPVGTASAPLAAWLRERGLAWAREGRARLAWDTVAAALARTPAVETAVHRGRALAAADTTSLIAEHVLRRLPGASDRREHAA